MQFSSHGTDSGINSHRNVREAEYTQKKPGTESKKIIDVPDLSITLDYNAIFSLVKSTVKMALNRERVGIGLALTDLPNIMGAFWQVDSNYIVMNENLIRAVKVSVKSTEEFNSYVFVILMHEYIHSLGYIDEMETRDLTRNICSVMFPEKHPAYKLGTSDPWEVYPFLKFLPRSGDTSLKIISKFDTDSTSYIA